MSELWDLIRKYIQNMRLSCTIWFTVRIIKLSSTYNVIPEENLHDRGKSPYYDVILTEDLSDIHSVPPDSGVDTLLESVVNGSVQNDVVLTKDESRQGDVFSNEKSADETKDDIDDDGQEQKVIVEVSR